MSTRENIRLIARAPFHYPTKPLFAPDNIFLNFVGNVPANLANSLDPDQDDKKTLH